MGSKKSIFMLSLLIIAIITLSAVSASESTDSDNFNLVDDGGNSLGGSINEDLLNGNVQSDDENLQLISEEKNDDVLNSMDEDIELSDSNFNDSQLGADSPGTFADLQAEINNAPAGSVLHLTRDYEGAEDTVVKLNKDLTIDGNGHTIDCIVFYQMFVPKYLFAQFS